MDKFTADLHIHSRFSRATSKKLTLRNLDAWGRVKGLQVLGTGDFTHPQWLEELETELEEDGNGLYRLKSPVKVGEEVPGVEKDMGGRVRFMLQTEISSIYKRGGKVRKVHNLVFMPDLQSVKKFNEKLGQVGNLASDGRPILGLDSRNLLEMVLETDPKAFLIPAHIWTPWFSLFGSKSGFDTVEECFGDLSGEIFAMETGLSSDPEMNWTWSALDKIKLISNSDAHSGEKLAREANLFQGEPSYEGIYRALRNEGLGHKFIGTVEFFPEEGKYHLDGHRKCSVVMDPTETRSRGGICPVCGKPMTLGVLYRITELADRPEPIQPAGQPGFISLIPLKEIISEVVGTGPGTKKVATMYNRIMAEVGSELDVLQRIPVEDIKKQSSCLAEGISRMREGQVIRASGFDGQYGVISVFTPQERQQMKSGAMLTGITLPEKRPEDFKDNEPCPASQPTPTPEPAKISFNKAQKKAVKAESGPLLVLAGPGTGKTQTLMGRIKRLLEQDEKPRRILALTFTRRAATELRERLERDIEQGAALPQAGTLHAHGFDYWKHVHGEEPVVLNEESSKKIFAEANPSLTDKELARAWRDYAMCRETLKKQDNGLREFGENYSLRKESWNLVDYTDLLEFQAEQFNADGFNSPYHHVLVDEIQDLSPLQIEVIKGLGGPEGKGLFAIGDPNQSIYGFRGAASDPEGLLREKWPKLRTITLESNYRSGEAILKAAAPVFPDSPPLKAEKEIQAGVRLFTAPDSMREASWLGEKINKLIGATSHSLADATGHGGLTPGEIAVLVRFRGLMPSVEKALKRYGIPYAIPEKEAFWNEPRVAAILDAAGGLLGLSENDSDEALNLPERILTQGPSGLSAFLGDEPPFDQFFWQGKAFKELKAAYAKRGGWAGLINWVQLQSGLELVRRSAEKVQLMTLHAAKGLEFEAVFMPALEEGILPFAGTGMLTGQLENPANGPVFDELEEKRLFYVGLTRAKSRLFLSHAKKRQLYGKTLNLPRSRFLEHIPEDIVTKSSLAARRVKKEKQISLLD